MKQVCTKCKETKDIKYFSWRTDTKKHRAQCKKCHKGYEIDLFDKRQEIEEFFLIGKKKCSKCCQYKSVSEFSADANTKDNLYIRCKPCVNRYTSKVGRWQMIFKKYGLLQEDYEKMLVLQNNLCAICETSVPGGTYHVFAVDHCHITGKVRGLLCKNCNTALGILKDNINSFERAAIYLKNL